MISKSFSIKLPHQVRKENQELNIEYDTVYIRISELTEESKPHYSRGIYQIINKENNLKVYRKIKGVTWTNLKEGEVVIDYGTNVELGGRREKPSEIIIQRASGFLNKLKYYKRNPKEDVRIAYNFFRLSIVVGLLSIILGAASLWVTIVDKVN